MSLNDKLALNSCQFLTNHCTELCKSRPKNMMKFIRFIGHGCSIGHGCEAGALLKRSKKFPNRLVKEIVRFQKTIFH